MSTVTLTQTAPAKAAACSVDPKANAGVVDPSTDLPFNLTSLKAAIPAHCFVKNVWTSLWYLVRDFAFLAALYAVYPIVNRYGDALGLLKFVWSVNTTSEPGASACPVDCATRWIRQRHAGVAAQNPRTYSSVCLPALP